MSNFYSFKQSRFYLALVEESLTKIRPSLSDGITQVEHIMPQTPTRTWKEEFGADDEKYEQYVNSIGNLTLIRHNSELGNKPFAEKKKMFFHVHFRGLLNYVMYLFWSHGLYGPAMLKKRSMA